MSSFLDTALEQQRDRTPGAEVWRGTIGQTATFATTNDRLPVTIPAWADQLELPVLCRWQPRVTPVNLNLAEAGEPARMTELAQVVYPQKGNACLVAFDENDEPWIVHYSPEGT